MHNLPMTEDQTIEQQIVSKGLTAPRVTPEGIEENIADIRFFTAEQGVKGAFLSSDKQNGAGGPPSLALLTFCVLTLRNGFTVTGESACASPENFDAEIGRNIALANARAKIWPLMGYALKEQLSQGA